MVSGNIFVFKVFDFFDNDENDVVIDWVFVYNLWLDNNNGNYLGIISMMLMYVYCEGFFKFCFSFSDVCCVYFFGFLFV